MKIIKAIDDKLEYWIMVLLSIVTVVVVFAQVVCRVTGQALPWSEELARYCFIWMICIGTSYAVKLNKLTSVDMLVNLTRPKIRWIIAICVNLVILAFSTVVVYYGAKSSAIMLHYGHTSPALSIPKGYIYLSAPVGFGLAGIRAIQNIVRLARGGYEQTTTNQEGSAI